MGSLLDSQKPIFIRTNCQPTTRSSMEICFVCCVATTNISLTRVYEGALCAVRAVARDPRGLIGILVNKLECGKSPERPLLWEKGLLEISKKVTYCWAVVSPPAARGWGITQRASRDAP